MGADLSSGRIRNVGSEEMEALGPDALSAGGASAYERMLTALRTAATAGYRYARLNGSEEQWNLNAEEGLTGASHSGALYPPHPCESPS